MRTLLAFLGLLLLSSQAFAAEPDMDIASNEALINELTTLDFETPGIDQTGWYGAFIAEDKPARFRSGLLGSPVPSVPPMMRELVRRGTSALPDLLRHLSDARPTHLLIGGRDPMDTVGGQFFSTKYVARSRPAARCSAAPCLPPKKDFNGQYTVKIGDVCYTLIGQIVNRWLITVRYQPTAILIVNSPIQSPELAEKARKDWSDLTVAEHKTSLLTDVRAAKGGDFGSSGALARLRFYYPDAYATLSGDDAKKRAAFEAEEKKEAQRP